MFGFTINWEKNQLGLSQKIVFLGLEIDSVKMTIATPWQKVGNIRKYILDISKGAYPIREVCEVVGKILTTGPAK